MDTGMPNASAKDQLIARSIVTLRRIFLFQITLFAIAMTIMAVINLNNYLLTPKIVIIINSCLLGFIGCVIYFSRKSYVYLITNKLSKTVQNEASIDCARSTLIGYYLYLIFRPFVGLVIGLLFFMLISTGIVSFMKSAINLETDISTSGKYFIYILSFLAGHTSSDMFDYFSKVAKKITLNMY